MGAKRILLLAGTQEARTLAVHLVDAGHKVIASLAGATKQPRSLPAPTRHGGFGGWAAQAQYIAERRFDLVVDATHPFATKITARTAEICSEMGLPYLRFSRPPWQPQEGENWQEVRGPSELDALIPADAKVFLATGGQSRDIAGALPGRLIFCRRVDGGPAPFTLSGGWITGRPPFTVEAEMELFQRLGITCLVAKNAGGPARAKLHAAYSLGIMVAMITRPEGLIGKQDALWPVVTCLEDVLQWVEARK